ncbi:MAG TPA: MBG domain-containing protein, partial [Hanamia sp.]|nr:MBG domain-containing protein [Hanamia sp.]
PTATGSSLDLGASFTDVPGGTASWTFNGGTNYNNQSGTAAIVINKKAASVTPDAASKYCGQSDPSFTGILSGFLASDNVTASYSRTPANESVGASYTINATLSPIGVLNNYNITYNTANFTINSVAIDASATSTAIQLGTATKTLTATVTSGIIPVNAAAVTFTVTNNVNGNVNTVATVSATTGSNGVATYNLNSGSLPVGLYAVTAVAGSGCSQSTAYFSVYDPNAGFVTGGGWINSPVGAYSADPTLTGKANFGFNAQYKKGNNTPDGNTEFQFKAGDLNFKSSQYDLGSLVIAGAKAIFKGTGTINGSGNYNFMVSAIDGSVSGGGGVDKFRIKIWTSGGVVVYDNNMGTMDNGDPSTVLGGGSIVIHNAKNSSNRITNTSVITVDTIATSNTSISIDRGATVDKLTIKVMPNPAPLFFTLDIQSPDNGKIKMTVVDIAGRIIEQRTDVPANGTIQIGDSYRPGVYFAEVIQGKVKIVLRLIKGRR